MLPPETDLIEEHLLQITRQEEVFAILQFDNDFFWSEAVWSAADEGGEVYHHKHAESALAQEINTFIGKWQREHGDDPNTCTITIKYSPCPECSRRHLPFISRALEARGVTHKYLYYLDRYKGLGELAALEGIELASAHFTEVDLYGRRRRAWETLKNKYWWEMGYKEAPKGKSRRR